MKEKRDSRSIHNLIDQTIEERPKLAERWQQTAVRRELAAKLVELRKRAGLTQKEFAQRANWDQAQVSRMEAATGSMPTARNIEHYAQTCGLEAIYAFVAPGPDGAHITDIVALGGESAAQPMSHLADQAPDGQEISG